MQMHFAAMYQITVILGLQSPQAVEAQNVVAHPTTVVIVLLQ